MSFFEDLKKKYTELLNPIKQSLSDNKGWIRQGKFTPVQQLKENFTKAPTMSIGIAQVPNVFNPQVRQINSNFLNKAGSTLQNQFNIQKRDFNEYFINPLKEHPVLGPATTNIEKGVSALGRTAQGYGEYFKTLTLPQEQRQQQLKQLESKYTYGNAFKETKDVTKGVLTAYGLASPQTAVKSMLGGGLINTAIQGVQNVANKIPVTTGMGESFLTGAGTGLAYSGTNRLTNGLVQYFSNSIPLLNSLTEQSIQKGAPVATDTLKMGIKKFFSTAGKNILKAAVIETAVETPIWGTLNQKEQETLLQSFQREAVENLTMNVGMAGINTITDSKALFPIIKKSINDVIQNKIYSPEGIALQSGKINFGADVGNVKPSQPIKTGEVGGVENLGKDEVIMYHRTTPQNAEQILKTGKMYSKENTGEIFLSNKKEGQAVGYGEALVPVKVKKSDLRLDDEFPSGEKHYAVSSNKVTPISQPIKTGGVGDLTWAKGTRAAGIQNAGIKNYNQATKALEKAGELPTVIKTDKTTKDFIKNYYETKKIPVVGDIFENAKGEKVEITKIGDNSVDYFLKGKKKGISGTVYLENPISQPIKTGEVQVPKNIPLEQPRGPELKQRGFSASVQEAPNVSKEVKAQVLGGYEPKPNEKLMGEAKALLVEGGDIRNIGKIPDIDKKVAATMQEAINQQKLGNHEAAANLFNNLSEVGTELGRGVQAFSLLKNMSPEAISLSVAGKIKKYNQTAKVKIPELTGEQQKLISEKVIELDLLKGREKNIALNELNNLISKFIPSSLSDKAITVWKAGLLTSLRTHERNFIGNTIHGALETAKDVPGSFADILMSQKTGVRTLVPTVKGMGEFGSKSTREQMADIFTKGYDPTEEVKKFDYKKINWGNGKIEQILKKYTDVVFRSLEVSDKPFYNAAMSRSLYSQAASEAINQGRRGDVKFIQRLVTTPTEEMIKTAINDANYATFKNRNYASTVANSIKRTLGQTELGKIVGEVTMPFTGVPSSILGQVVDYSPVGFLKGIYNTGKVVSGSVPELQRQAAQEIGRGVIGSGIYGLGAYLMSKGLITGQPKDAEEQRLWDAQNKPRNSIMINGKWRSLNSIGPEAVVFLAGSKLQEELKNGGNIGTYGVAVGKDYLDQSFVQGLQGPVNALTDPKRYAKSYVGNQISSVIPNIVKDLSKSTDPYQREANTVTDYTKLSIPGLRQTLTEKRDVLGNVMKQEPSGASAFFDLFNSKTPITNNTMNELGRLYNVGSGATPSKLSANQTILKQKVKLTPEQLNNLEAGVGEALKPKLETLINSPVYAQLDDEAKAKAIDKLVSDTRSQYKNINADTILSGKSATGSPQINTTVSSTYKSGTQTTPIGKTYEYIDKDGNYKTVDLTPIQKPTLTGMTELDKKLISGYNSDINSQISGIMKLYENKQLSATQANDMITSLKKASISKAKKPKKITLKKPKVIKIKLPKMKKIKIPKAKKVKVYKIPKRIKLR